MTTCHSKYMDRSSVEAGTVPSWFTLTRHEQDPAPEGTGEAETPNWEDPAVMQDEAAKFGVSLPYLPGRTR